MIAIVYRVGVHHHLTTEQTLYTDRKNKRHFCAATSGASPPEHPRASQLKARQEMTDTLRDKLSSSPSTQHATEAQLKLLFYTDPHLAPRKGD